MYCVKIPPNFSGLLNFSLRYFFFYCYFIFLRTSEKRKGSTPTDGNSRLAGLCKEELPGRDGEVVKFLKTKAVL